MSARADRIFKIALQIVASGLLVLMSAVILHKGYTDVSRLAGEHRGDDFRLALLRHLFKNMAGG